MNKSTLQLPDPCYAPRQLQFSNVLHHALTSMTGIIKKLSVHSHAIVVFIPNDVQKCF